MGPARAGFTGAVTRAGRLRAAPDGQHRFAAPPASTLRSRDLSGIRSRANSPVPFARNLLALRELVRTIGPPAWAASSTAAALHQFDGYVLEPPFHLLVPRDRNAVRMGHVVHTTRSMGPLDKAGAARGVPVEFSCAAQVNPLE